MTLYFTSDHHFGHRNIIDYCERPFESVEEMTEIMIDRWNEVVHTKDTVYYGGDLSMGARKGTNIGEILSRLNGYKILMPGNHDECFRMRKKWRGWESAYLFAGFHEIIDEYWIDLEIQGQNFRFSHFPYGAEDHTSEARFVECRPPDEGDWLICGHIHEKWKVKDKQINIGVDVWDFYPVHEDALIQIVRDHDEDISS
jgi:calcineurin-like phosphoesterase family protein